MGRFSICSEVRTPCTVACSVFTVTSEACTSTTCELCPTVSFTLADVVVFTWTTTDTSAVLNPAPSTRTTYSPGISAPVANVPDDVVVVVMAWFVPLLVIRTFAALTTAPLGSVTVPTILPVLIVVCANIVDDSNTRVAKPSRPNRTLKRRGELKFDIVNRPFGIVLIDEF